MNQAEDRQLQRCAGGRKEEIARQSGEESPMLVVPHNGSHACSWKKHGVRDAPARELASIGACASKVVQRGVPQDLAACGDQIDACHQRGAADLSALVPRWCGAVDHATTRYTFTG